MSKADIFVVVCNHEGYYSIWPQLRKLPDGWVKCAFEGDKSACLDHIATIWTDMRPLGSRARLAVSDQTA